MMLHGVAVCVDNFFLEFSCHVGVSINSWHLLRKLTASSTSSVVLLARFCAAK